MTASQPAYTSAVVAFTDEPRCTGGSRGRRGLNVLAASTLILWPGMAGAADGLVASSWPVAAGAGFLVALAALLPLVLILRRRAAGLSQDVEEVGVQRAELAELLAAAPDGYWLWPHEGAGRGSPGLATLLGRPKVSAWEHVRAVLSADRYAGLDEAVAGLRERGEPFDLTVATADGSHSLRLLGRRVSGTTTRWSADLVWLQDATATSRALAAARAAAEVDAAQRDSLEATLAALPLPVWRRRPDLGLEWCNAAYGRAVATEPAEAVASGLEIGAGAIDRQGRALAERARKTGLAQAESHHLVVDGARRLFDFTEQPLDLPHDGNDPAIFGYALDCTNLADMQEELSRHIAAHGEVLGKLASSIAIYAPDTRLKFYNRAFVKLWGLEEGWLDSEPTLGEIFEALRERRRLPEYVDFPKFKQDRLKLFTSLIEPMEELIYLPDDTTLRSIVSPHPFGGLLFIFEDVTDRLALERSYDTLSAVQEATINNLYEGVAVFGSDGRLKLSNPAFARLWDLTPESLADQPHVSDVIEKTKRFFDIRDDWAEVKSRIIGRITEPEPRSGRLERRDGTVLDYACEPLPDGACLLSYVDVTDRFRVERALRERTEALEAADRLKTEFIANVSYELRTPLNSMIGFAEILGRQYFGSLNERQTEYIDGILTSSQRLLSLINDILDLATIEAGYLHLELAPVELSGLVNAVAGLTRERARSENLTLDVQCPADIGRLEGDERRLKQALFNLVSNAIQFTPAGGAVTLSARREGTADDEEVVFEISDTGRGIPEADQARVFDKFERANPASRESGPGLGLSLVKSLIELHGGRVALASVPGEGTQVSCRLPARGGGETTAALDAEIGQRNANA